MQELANSKDGANTGVREAKQPPETANLPNKEVDKLKA